jgi:hypothetical protein
MAFMALNDRFSKKVRDVAGKVFILNSLISDAREEWAMEQLNISRERNLAALAAHQASTRLLCTATKDVRLTRMTVCLLSQEKLLLEAKNDILELPGVVETIKDVLYPTIPKTHVSKKQMSRVWDVVAILKKSGVRGESLLKTGLPLPVSGNPSRLIFVNDGAYRLAIRITQAFDRKRLPTSVKKYYPKK